MRIIFICGSLEPGRDGVGDYTRSLAVELVKNGHHTLAIALNDSFVNEIISTNQSNNAGSIKVLRLPASYDLTNKFEYANDWINEINPDLLSLQFVPFSFHPKGLSVSLNTFLKKIGKGRQWHIMFHELWVGMAVNDSFKRKLWGFGQKILIKNMIKRLRPKLIHTQCEVYLEQLKSEGFEVEKLNLFSNIDVNATADNVRISHKYHIDKNSKYKFIFFGGLHLDTKLEQLIATLKRSTNLKNSDFEFLYVGRNGNELANHIGFLKSKNIKYSVFGELLPEDISYLLSISNIGIATGSPQFLEKNGTIAAMLAHQLPVLCIGKSFLFKKNLNDKKLGHIYFLPELEQLLFHPSKVWKSNSLSEITTQFVNSVLQQISS